MSPLRAIVFDFDGVLANSEPLHFEAFRDVLAGEGVTLGEGDYYSRYLGFDDVGSFERIAIDCGRRWNADKVRALIEQKAVRMEVLERDRSVLFPGAADIVRRAAARVPLAIASGALGFEILRILDREQLTSCFTAIVAAGDTAVSKPSPEPYLQAVARLRSAVSPSLLESDCAAIEDSVWGLESARRAGLRTVGVAHTYPGSALDADLIVESIDRLDVDGLAALWSF